MNQLSPPCCVEPGLRVATALVVGGSEERLRDLCAELEWHGLECIEAENGVEALKYCSSLGIDLILVFSDMPVMSGREFVSIVGRGAFGAVAPPIIGLTTNEHLPEVGELAFEATVWLKAPVNRNAVEEALAAAFPVE